MVKEKKRWVEESEGNYKQEGHTGQKKPRRKTRRIHKAVDEVQERRRGGGRKS